MVCTQVERHMRPCLATLGGSEPLPAETAYELMDGTKSVGSGAPFDKPFKTSIASIVGGKGNSMQLISV